TKYRQTKKKETRIQNSYVRKNEGNVHAQRPERPACRFLLCRNHDGRRSWYNVGRHPEEESVLCTGPGPFMNKRLFVPARLDAFLHRWFTGARWTTGSCSRSMCRFSSTRRSSS